MLQIECLGMLWLTNEAAVPTTPPGRGDRAVSVGRSLLIDSKVTRYPGRNSEAGGPGVFHDLSIPLPNPEFLAGCRVPFELIWRLRPTETALSPRPGGIVGTAAALVSHNIPNHPICNTPGPPG